MPRDLEAIAKDKTLDDMPELTKSPEDMDEKERQGPMDVGDEYEGGLLFSQLSQRNEKRDELHPYTQTLSMSDLESCVRVEEEAFPPHERATREKVSSHILLYTPFVTLYLVTTCRYTCHIRSVLLGVCVVILLLFSTWLASYKLGTSHFVPDFVSR